MKSGFNDIAGQYDQSFSNSVVGKAQRNITHNFLKKYINHSGLNILEINCGTGEDAVFLAPNNFVVATDASAEMLAIAEKKIHKNGLNTKCKTLLWDLNFHFPMKDKNKYDLIFSNFGGLNCLSPESLNNLSFEVNYLLSPGGKMVFVIMGRFCLWEWMYFILKGKWAEATRRRSKEGIRAKLNENVFAHTWYYSSKEIKSSFSQFKYIRKKPVGLFIPPSYLNNYFRNKKYLMNILIFFEKIFGRFGIFSGMSDHYIIEFRK